MEADDGEEALTKYTETNPELVLMDITMPVMDGLQSLQSIKRSNPQARVIMCSAMGQEGMVVEAIKPGASDLLSSLLNRTDLFKLLKMYWGLNRRVAN